MNRMIWPAVTMRRRRDVCPEVGLASSILPSTPFFDRVWRTKILEKNQIYLVERVVRGEERGEIFVKSGKKTKLQSIREYKGIK